MRPRTDTQTDRQTDRHTNAGDHSTFGVVYTTHTKCKEYTPNNPYHTTIS